MNDPYFTVIIPTYNRPDLLAQAVGSVVSQSDPDWELIIVDDASPVEAVAPNDPRIRVLRNDSNLGKAASLNRAAKISRGQIVTILDDDDMFGVDRLRHARLAHKMAPVACCAAAEPASPKVAAAATPAPHMKLVPFTWNAPIPSAGALSLAKSHWVDLDPDLRACEDVDWVMRLQESCSDMVWIDSPDWVWGRHEGPRHLNGTRARVEGTRRLLIKHKDYYRRESSAHAHRLYRLGVLYRNLGNRWRALGNALLSLMRRPNAPAMRLAISTLVPKRQQ